MLERRRETSAVACHPGLIVVGPSSHVVAANSEALRILAFPEQAESIAHPELWLTDKVRAALVHRGRPPKVSGEFRSSRRTYICRSFPIDLTGRKAHYPLSASIAPESFILLLERKVNERVVIQEIAERFRLTAREQETITCLLEGLTSKEIAQHMDISPNTVKAFIRLVMVKMGVSTRSGIVGKIVGSRAEAGHARIDCHGQIMCYDLDRLTRGG